MHANAIDLKHARDPIAEKEQGGVCFIFAACWVTEGVSELPIQRLYLWLTCSDSGLISSRMWTGLALMHCDHVQWEVGVHCQGNSKDTASDFFFCARVSGDKHNYTH